MQPVRPYKRRSFFGPIVLIAVGVIALLINMGAITLKSAFIGFAKYWPVLIIVWGLVKLFEYLQARNQGLPAPGIGAGGVIAIVLICVLGLSTSAAYRVSQKVDRDDIEAMIGEDIQIGFFGDKHEYAETLDTDLPLNGRVAVTLERGAIELTASPDDRVHIHVRKAVYANSEEEARHLNEQMKVGASVSGDLLTIDASKRGAWSGTADLRIAVPRKAEVELLTLRGPVTVRDREANVKAQASRGDITIETVKGHVEANIRRGDFTARKINGNLRLDGRADDLDISDVTGRVELNGDFFGDTKLARVAQGVHFKSARTDLEFGKLTGAMRMDPGDLHVDQVAGPFTVETKNKDIEIEGFTGSLRVVNQRGDVRLRPSLPLGSVSVENEKGSVRVLLPPGANVDVDAVARRGEFESDFNIPHTEQGGESRATGKINKGGARMQLKTEYGTIAVLRADSLAALEDRDDRREREIDSKVREAERKVREAEKRIEEHMERRDR